MSVNAISARGAVLLLCLLSTACGGASNIYQGMDAPALYQLAEHEYQSQEYDRAIRALDRLTLAFGDWERIPDARLLLASSYYAKEEYLTARSEYQRFLDRYAGHPRAPEAALGECRSLAALSPSPQRDQEYTKDAVTVCRNAVADYAGTPQAQIADSIGLAMRSTLAEKEYLNADFYYRRKLYDSAIKYYQFVVDLYSDTDFAPRALLGLYLANEAIGYDDLAEAAKEQLLSRYPDSEAAEKVRADGLGS